MATASRDTKLSLSVETLGTSNLTKLEAALLELAKTGGEGSAEFRKLADEVNRLGEQSSAVAALKSIKAETEALTSAHDAATTAMRKSAVELDGLREKTAAAAAANLKAKDAYDANSESIKRNQGDIKLLDKDSSEYAATLNRLKTEIRDANVASVALDRSRKESSAALAQATAAEKAAENQHNKLVEAYQKSGDALDRKSALLKDSAKVAEELGVETSDLVAAEKALLDTYTKGLNAVQQRTQAIKEMTEATRLYEIEKAGELELQRRGEAALWAETAALREAEKAAEQYALARAKKIADEKVWQDEAHAIVEAAHAAQKLAREAAILQEVERKLALETALLTRETRDASDEIENMFRALGTRTFRDVQSELAGVNAAMVQLQAYGQRTGTSIAADMGVAARRVNELEREMRQLTGTLTLADKASDLLRNSMGQITAGNLIADGVGFLVEKVKEAARTFWTANVDAERLNRTLTQITGTAEGAAAQIGFLRDVANRAGISVTSITDSFIKFQASASASGMSLTEVNKMFEAVTVAGSRMGMSSERVAWSLDALSQMASKSVVSMEELRQQLGESLPGATAIAAKGLGLTVSELTKLVESGQLTAEEFFPAFRRGLEETFGSAEKPVEGLVQAIARLGNKFIELYQKATGSAAFKALENGTNALTENFDTLVASVTMLGKALVALKVVEYARNLAGMGAAAKSAAADMSASTAATNASTASTGANTAATLANSRATTAKGVATTAAAAATKAKSAATATDTAATVANTAATAANTKAVAAQGAATALTTAAATASVGAFNLIGGALNGVRNAVGLATGAFRSLIALIGGLPGLLLLVTLNARELGVALGETVASWGRAGAALRRYDAEMQAQAEREKKIAAEAEARRARVLQLMQRELRQFSEKTAALEAEEAAVKAGTEAQSKRADMIERTAALYGTEAAAMQAASEAAHVNLDAALEENRVRAEHVAAMEREILARERLLKESGLSNEKAQDELKAIREKLAVSKEQLAQSNALVATMKVEAAERDILTKSYADNSARVAEYAETLEQAKKTLSDVVTMEQRGLPVKEAVVTANLKLAEATRLYNDSVQDNIEKIKAKNTLDQANLTLQTAGLQARQVELEAMIGVAKASGNLVEATRLEIESKQIQIEITKLAAEAKRLEAKAAIEAAQAELAQLKTTNQLTEAKRLELEARIATAKAKEVEANASDSAIKMLELEIRKLREGNNARKDSKTAIDNETSALDRNTDSRERAIAAREREYELAEREEELRRKHLNIDANGFTLDNNGNRMSQSVASDAYILDAAKSAGLSNEQTKELIQRFFANGRATGIQNQGINGPSKDWFSLVNEAITRMRVDALNAQPVAAPAPAPTGRATAINTTPSASTTGTGTTVQQRSGNVVNVYVGQKRSTVNVVSTSDADTLVGLLRQLESDGGRAA